ncbi:unnamed protein product [Nezara viridula]|uniref:Lipase domain-containing protein n=1 Tax=Nezara viridula TaxID=85310 RepID=A0A9P0MLI7_NEZVI|nr:unnamed protein product [Nezara viridula]
MSVLLILFKKTRLIYIKKKSSAPPKKSRIHFCNLLRSLDPAEVLFAESPLEYILDKEDAPLVEIIHTSGGFLGFKRPLGHRDFYPNGGLFPQPGCPGDISGLCSHRRAYQYFAEAVKNRGWGFKATKCDSMKNYTSGKCSGCPKLLMSNSNYNPALNGTFFLFTNSQPPFGRK